MGGGGEQSWGVEVRTDVGGGGERSLWIEERTGGVGGGGGGANERLAETFFYRFSW